MPGFCRSRTLNFANCRQTVAGFALAVLGALGAQAFAQSSVQIYGKIDLGVGRPTGSDTTMVFDSGNANTSRLGFRGTEDLGGGMAAMFLLEHRFRPDTGMDTTVSPALPSGRFWQGSSTVGLKTPYGTVTLGRQYTASWTMVQNQIDPYAAETVAALRGVGMLASPGIAASRFADSIRYDRSFGKFNVAASIAEGDNADAPGPDRPWSAGFNYSADNWFFGAGYEDPAGARDKLWNVGARYVIGPATLAAGFSRGRTNSNVKVTGWLVGATIRQGSADIKIGIGERKSDPASTVTNLSAVRKYGVGYHYWLSKRTKIYTDIARDERAPANRLGYDVGLQHNF